ncbi:MAG: PadR family transcriptional regulator [Defluviitaleaceae bacterium]|nr:PadR family transcriptional regulator [Defluviitaleaceae bacterium]
MSLPHGLLGLLQYKERTGYELAKLFEVSLNKFWHAQASQIYRELNRMEELGWVTSQNVVQHGKPNKRVYAITENGQAEFVKWMHTPANLIKNRHSPLLMYIFFGSAAPDRILEILISLRDAAKAALGAQAPENQANINHYKAISPNGEREALYWEMTHAYGIAEVKAMIEWAQDCINKLENLEGGKND